MERLLEQGFVILVPYNPGSLTLSNDKILDWSKLKAFADNNINLTRKLKLDLEWIENIVGNVLSPQWFRQANLYRVVKYWDCVVKS